MMIAKRTRERTRQIAKSSPLTMEALVYFIIALLAVGLRLYNLDSRPMQAGEAAQALTAWRAAQGLAQDSVTSQSPFLFTINLFLFSLFGGNDFLARLAPALGGVLLVIGPYFLRHHLGRMGALAASFLLALSPSVLFFSRYLGGEVIVAACALAMIWGLFGYLDQRQPKYLSLVAAALALALSAGAGAYTFVLIVVTCGLVLALVNRFSDFGGYWQRISDAWQVARGTNGLWQASLLRDFAALLALTFVLICTGFLLHPSGLQDGIDLFSGWLSAFQPRVGGQPWYYHLQLLLVYEPLILVFGLAAVVSLLRQRDLFFIFLTYWSAAAFLIYVLAGGRGPGDVLLITLPLALLAGSFIGQLLQELASKASWAREGLFAAVAFVVIAHLGLQLGAHVASGRRDYLYLALASGFILMGLFVLCWISFERGLALRAGGLVVLLSLVALTVSISCWLNHWRDSDPREIIVASPTSQHVFDLVETLHVVSSRKGDSRAIDMTVHQGVGSALAWYLRDFENVNLVAELSPSIATPVVIAPAGEQDPTLGAQYSGQDFVLTSSWRPRGLAGADLMRWLFYRRASTPVQTERVILWVKQEAVQAGGE